MFYEGRRDTQIKFRGNRIDVSEVERNVNELDYVQKSALLVCQSKESEQALVAFITLKNNFLLTSLEVEGDLKTGSRLAYYMIPQVVILEQLPYLNNGKVDRQQLLKFFQTMAGVV